MRFEVIKQLTGKKAYLIDISQQISSLNRINKSIGWRLNLGPLVWKVNSAINHFLTLNKFDFDLIWIDKGVFIYKEVLLELKSRTRTLLHYTPDTAFLANRSRYFVKGIHLYDILITTKSFELDYYFKYVNKNKVILLTQGYNPKVHFPRIEFFRKKDIITFVGLYEPYRAEILNALLESGYKIVLGGIGWSKFLKSKTLQNDQITFLGEKVVNEQYALAISTSKFALGLLSKKFPELHTTRTFEIPACGTCLVTEENSEINSFFSDEECLKFQNINDLIQKIKYLSANPNQLELVTQKGYDRMRRENRDYHNQILEVFKIAINN
jgi:hypothetical protein